jgi:hypothetical protein
MKDDCPRRPAVDSEHNVTRQHLRAMSVTAAGIQATIDLAATRRTENATGMDEKIQANR